jgi:competence protein ComGD
MEKQSGFTLVEMLFVFSIFLVIASVSAIYIRPQYALFEKEQFYSQFKADLLYSQQYAISHQKYLVVYIRPKENHYFVLEKGTNKRIVDREIPESITLVQGTMKWDFEIVPNGVINRFGTLFFLVDKQRYKITIQIGAGRLYVVKE